MILEMVEFERPEGFSDTDLLEDARSTIPWWKGYEGLIRKQFVTDGPMVMGVYMWESRAQAEAAHDADWVAGFRSRTGVEPRFRYFDMFMQIDNAADAVSEYPVAPG